MMKNHMRALCVAASVVALPFLMVGCDREVSHTSSTSVNDDGSSKSKEKVVTQANDGSVTKDEVNKSVGSDGAAKSQETTTVQSPDGTVTKEESKKTTAPNMP